MLQFETFFSYEGALNLENEDDQPIQSQSENYDELDEIMAGGMDDNSNGDEDDDDYAEDNENDDVENEIEMEMQMEMEEDEDEDDEDDDDFDDFGDD